MVRILPEESMLAGNRLWRDFGSCVGRVVLVYMCAGLSKKAEERQPQSESVKLTISKLAESETVFSRSLSTLPRSPLDDEVRLLIIVPTIFLVMSPSV